MKIINSLLIVVFTAIAFTTSTAQQQDNQKLLMEFYQLQMEMQGLQQKAFEDKSLADLRDKFTALLDKETKAISKEASKLVDEKNQIIKDFTAAKDKNDQQKMQDLSVKARDAMQKLAPFQQQIVTKENVVKMQQKFQKAMETKMTQLDPDFPKKIARMEQLKAILSGGK